jgi:hypothetical protein
MFLAHSFRLRDPWQCDCTLEGTLEGTLESTVRWSRVFHLPTGLEDDDALWLVCSGLPERAQVTLNTTPLSRLSADAPHQYDVTSLLADTNRIELEIPPAACGLASLSPSPVPRPPSGGNAFPYDVRLGVIGHS